MRSGLLVPVLFFVASLSALAPQPLAAQMQNDPRLIDVTTPRQLNAIRWDLNGDGIADASATSASYAAAFPTTCTSSCGGYELRNNLDLNTGSASTRTDDLYWNDGAGWEPIGDRYNALFRGNGYFIENLYINRSSASYVGLFARQTTSSDIANFGIEGVGLVNVDVTGGAYTGGLLGAAAASVRSSFVTGRVAGRMGGGGTGCLAGLISDGSLIANYTACDLVAGVGPTAGVVGRGDGGEIVAAYSRSRTISGDPTGGLVAGGSSAVTVTNSYWDVQTSGLSTSHRGGASTDTAVLRMPTTYTGIYADWNVSVDGNSTPDDPWSFGTFLDYPVLRGGSSANVARQFLLQPQIELAATLTGAATVAEGGTAMYTVSVPIAAPYAVTVRWEVTGVSGGDGAAAADFRADADATMSLAAFPTGTATIMAGSSSTMFSVYVFDDPNEENAERFQVSVDGVADAGVRIVASTSTESSVVTTIGISDGRDYDDDDDNLIDVESPAQLAAILYDLGGAGITGVSDEDMANYVAAAAFPFFDADSCPDTCAGYELSNDIDLSGVASWQPIGGGSQGNAAYTGVFEGNGYVISNMEIAPDSRLDNVGLFGILGAGGIIRNIGLRDVDVDVSTGSILAGGLAGINRGKIAVSYVIGGRVRTGFGAGGLAGSNEGTVVASYADVAAHGKNSGSSGGLLAHVGASGVVSASYSVGAVTGSGNMLGGLIGELAGGEIISSYFDSERSRQTACCGANTPTTDVSAKTSHELRVPTAAVGIYAGWDRLNVDGAGGNDDSPWDFGGVFDYPVLLFGGEAGTRPARRTSQQQAQPAVSLTPMLSGSMTVSEGDTASYVVSLPEALPAGITASWIWAVSGAEIDAMDVAATAGVVVIAPGRSSASFLVMVLADGVAEVDEVMVVSMSNALLAGAPDDVSLGVPAAAVRTTIETTISPPPPPSGLTATSTVPGRVTVSWEQSTDVSAGRVTEYQSGFGEAGGDPASISYTPIAGSDNLTLSRTFTRLTGGVAYDFYIRAVNVIGMGTPAMVSETAMAANYNADGNNLIDVATTAQLAAIRHDLSGGGNSSANEWLDAFPGAPQGMGCPGGMCAGYELSNDIDLSSVAFWQPIGGGVALFMGTGDSGGYTGVFEGNGYVISNLNMADPGRGLSNVGLFGLLGGGGIIRNVGVKDVNVDLSAGSILAGGLVGLNHGTIAASYVIGGRVQTGAGAGGLVGSNFAGTVVASYAAVAAHAKGGGGSSGGLFAHMGASGVVSASYSIGAVTGVNGSVLGGLIGDLGGGEIISSYFDRERSGQMECCGSNLPSLDVHAKTSHWLRIPTTAAGIYAGWDRLNVDGDDTADAPWDFGTVFDYPVLVFGGSTDTRQARRMSQQQAQPAVSLTPTLSGSATVSEGDTASYVVDLPTVLPAGVSASWSWAVGGAGIDVMDVDTMSGVVVIAPDRSSASFSLMVRVDGEAELAEVMDVSLSTPLLSGAPGDVSLVVPGAAARTTIAANEFRLITVSAQPTQVEEGGITTFTVALADGVDQGVIVEYEITTASEGLTPGDLEIVTEVERAGTSSAPVNTLPLAGSVTLRTDGTAEVSVRVASDAVPDEDRERFRLRLTGCANCGSPYAAAIGSPSFAEVAIRSERGITVDARVYLQGAYDRDELNMLTRLADILPRRQPYWVAPWNYPATTTVMHVPNDRPGLSGVTSTIVDWVLVELRSGANAAAAAAARPTTGGRAAGLLLSDGRIAGINEAATTTAESLSLEGVRFEADLPQGEDVYVLIHHRNHLSVMSAQPATNTSVGVCSTDPDYCVDFRDKQSYIGCGQVSLSDSDELYGMYAGDVGRTGLITRADLAFIGDNDSERPTYARMIEGNYLVDGDLDFSGLIARGDETEVGNNDSESSACSYRIVGN